MLTDEARRMRTARNDRTTHKRAGSVANLMNTPYSPGRAQAIAYPNFALVKYWGKRDADLNLPDVGSISITLDALWTRTRVELDPALERDSFELDGQIEAHGSGRVAALLERMRSIGGSETRSRVFSRNNFPTGAGLASSASGFAALVTAADRAYGLALSPSRLSELARIGSGSAARSIFGGYVEMHRGELPDGSDSVAEPLAAAADWPLAVVIAVSERGRKSVGSTEGMQRTAQTSPFYSAWVNNQPDDLALARPVISMRWRTFLKRAHWPCTAWPCRPGRVFCISMQRPWNACIAYVVCAARALRCFLPSMPARRSRRYVHRKRQIRWPPRSRMWPA